MSQLIFEVKRNRPSVTQGSATVYINGEEAITFGDEMYLLQNDGTFTSGHKVVEKAQHFGEVISGWGSITPDQNFIMGLLYNPKDDIYHHSEIVKKAIKSLGCEAGKEAINDDVPQEKTVEDTIKGYLKEHMTVGIRDYYEIPGDHAGGPHWLSVSVRLDKEEICENRTDLRYLFD